MKALILDCDGVLADTERDGHRVAFNRVFAENKVAFQWTDETYRQALQVGGGKERLRALLSREFLEQHELTNGIELETLIATWHRRKTELYVELLDSGAIEARSGVRRLSREALRQGWLLAVASTSAHESVRAVLNKVMGADLAGHFTVCAGDDVQLKKPAPDIYLLALNRLGVKAGDAVVVEDSAIGVQAALTAGITAVIATPSTYTIHEDLSAAAVVVSELGDPGQPIQNAGKGLDESMIDGVVEYRHLLELLNVKAPHTEVRGHANSQ